MSTLRLTLAGLFTTALTAACGVEGTAAPGTPASGGPGTDTSSEQAAAAPQAGASSPDAVAAALSDDAALVACDAFLADQALATDAPGWKTRLAQPPTFSFDDGHDYLWHLQTNKGEIVVRLWPDVAPAHVSSTLFLTRAGFYDGLTFHRVIPGFMAQGGCPLGNGMGGPGYQFAGEFKPGVSHDRPLLLSTANAGPGTDGSQFFLTFVPTPFLDGKHTLFGEVVAGAGTVKALEGKGSRSGRTSEPLVIESASIEVHAKSAE